MASPSAPLLLLLTACTTGEPVLQGVPGTPLLVPPEAGEEEAVASSEAPPDGRSANPELYQKAANVWVDINFLAGKSWSEVRGEANSQLGPLTESVDLPGDNGVELRFTRGAVRVADDRVYMVWVPLPEPTRRGEALEAVGLLPSTSKYLILHREFRLNNERGFRRIRMRRLDRDSEFVTEVEAWRWIPGERGAGR